MTRRRQDLGVAIKYQGPLPDTGNQELQLPTSRLEEHGLQEIQVTSEEFAQNEPLLQSKGVF
jgi:dihydroxyacid dehydratase/phosphogluconate dehydratase